MAGRCIIGLVKKQEIELPQAVSGWSSGVKDKRRHTLADLDGEIYLKAETPPTADVNGDGVVNIQDLVIVANALGEAAPDLNGDGVCQYTRFGHCCECVLDVIYPMNVRVERRKQMLMKFLIIVTVLFLFTVSVFAGTFLETFNGKDLEGWQEIWADKGTRCLGDC